MHPADHYVELFKGADQVMVWVCLTRTGIVLGPYFVQGNLDAREYLRIIRYNVVQRDFPINDINRNAMFWQQDGAPSHTSNATMQYIFVVNFLAKWSVNMVIGLGLPALLISQCVIFSFGYI